MLEHSHINYLKVVDAMNLSNVFACGCGESFSDKSEFKAHIFGRHEGNFVQGSSHYLTILTLIVVPIINVKQRESKDKDYNAVSDKQTINTMRFSKVSIKADKSQNTECEVATVKKVGKAKDEKIQKKLQGQKNDKYQIHHTQNSMKLVGSSQKMMVEWNGFKLIPNLACTIGPFYCGRCQLVFPYPDGYVQHCLQVCQELKQLSSSHFISTIFDTQSQMSQTHQSQQVVTQQILKVSRVVQKKNGSVGCRNDLQAGLVRGCSGLVALFEHKEKQISDEMPRCGICQKNYLVRGYKAHIARVHSEIVADGSSHVVIRRCSHGDKKICLVLMRMEGEDGLIWKCPCKQETVMSRQVFVKHVMEVHKGISIIYHWNSAN